MDVKRFVASAAVAAGRMVADEAAPAAVARRAAEPIAARCGASPPDSTLDVWYARISTSRTWRSRRGPRRAGRGPKSSCARSAGRGSRQVVGKLAEVVDGELRFKSLPPLVIPLRDLVEADEAGHVSEVRHRPAFSPYRGSLAPEAPPAARPVPAWSTSPARW